jgi:hypothetical protein
MPIQKSIKKIGTPIATRTLEIPGKRKQTVVVKIGLPRKTRLNWECQFQITGLKGHDEIHSSFGVDAIQAIAVAFEGIRYFLNKSKKKFRWMGGEPGDIGFPKSINTGLGLGFTKRIERLMEIETVNFVRKVTPKSSTK